MTTKKEIKSTAFMNSFVVAAQDSALAHTENANSFKAKFEQTKDTDFKAQQQRNETHAAYDKRLSEMSLAAQKTAESFKLDVAHILKQSREFKKRLIATLEALAASDKNKLDKAMLDAFSHVIANDKEKVRIAEIQAAMNHKTDTQASYFKRLFLYTDSAKFDKDAQVLEFNMSHKIVKAIFKLFD